MEHAIALPPITAEMTITTQLLTALRETNGQRWCMDDLVGSMRRKLGHTMAEDGDETMHQSRAMLKEFCTVCPHPCMMKHW